MVAFWAYIAVECVRLAREVKRIRAEQDPDDLPNETALRAGWTAMATRFGDRVYRSEATFLGLPLIDINLSAPMPPAAGKPAGSSAPDGGRRVARGWIAIGDDARGILLAIGSTARGLIAMGGRAVRRREFRGAGAGPGRIRRPRAGRPGNRRAGCWRLCLRRRSGRLAGGGRTGDRLGRRLSAAVRSPGTRPSAGPRSPATMPSAARPTPATPTTRRPGPSSSITRSRDSRSQ